jgi:hypothetical protein
MQREHLGPRFQKKARLPVDESLRKHRKIGSSLALNPRKTKRVRGPKIESGAQDERDSKSGTRDVAPRRGNGCVANRRFFRLQKRRRFGVLAPQVSKPGNASGRHCKRS